MKPPAKVLWLFAAVMAVLWAIVASGLVPMFVVAFGRGGGPLRYWAMLLLQAVVVALLCAYAYREGWKRGCEDQTKHLRG